MQEGGDPKQVILASMVPATDAPETSDRRWPVRSAIVVVAVFLLAALPFALWQFTSNSDEARYTLAAARMMETGDYIVPYSAWGEVRLLKPPLTYYYAVAGFSLFGQSIFAVKSMWLLSAAAILGLTWALAKGIGATRTGAAVAVAALASNLLFYRAALTHNPDIPQVLGIALALVGFVRLADEDRPPVWAPYAAWLGIAWAFMAKGLLALVLVGLALALRASYGRLRPSRHEIAAIVLAVVSVGWWYLAVALRQPDALVRQFLGDQVTEKAMLGAENIGALGYFAGFLALGFLPILIAAVPFRPKGIHRPSPGVLLLMLWALVIVVIFSFSNYRVARYLLPALPGVAALIGLWMGGLGGEDLARRVRRAVRLLLALSLVVVGLTAMIVYAGSTILAAVAGVVAGLAMIAALWWLAGTGRPTAALALLTVTLPLTVILFLPAYRVAGYPAAADHGVQAIEEAGLSTDRVYVLRRWHLMERIGLQVPPVEGFLYSSDIDPDLLAQAGMTLTIYPEIADELRARGWTVREERGAPEGFSADAFWRAIRERDIAGLRAAYGEPLYIATPPESGSDRPFLPMDQVEIPAVDENAEGLAEDEDRVGPVDGIGEQHDPASE